MLISCKSYTLLYISYICLPLLFRSGEEINIQDYKGDICLLNTFEATFYYSNQRDLLRMNDWAAPIIATALFGFLTPGLLIQLPAKNRPVDFLNMKTSIVSMLLHATLYGLLLILFLVVLDIHIYA
ncbi:hypothetical protein LIER_04327 [Lithospermum erythrorhizon]|uniref:Uncharacterized protein n=1 Tax=Lithospermum erythrorhizon TaxID=34254 RepID=A0AAV3NXQ4_LITER